MKVWVTGGAGFLGIRLAAALMERGHSVTRIDLRSAPGSGLSEVVDLASEAAPDALSRLADCRGTPEVVIHTASRQPGQFSYGDYCRGNVVTTARLLDGMHARPPRRIIYTSTLSVYGRPPAVPVDEQVVARPESPYAITKRASEQLLESFSTRSEVIVFRLPSMFGVGQADSFIDGLAARALRGQPITLFSQGRYCRDVLCVKDVVAALAAAVSATLIEPCVYVNLGCGQRVASSVYAHLLVQRMASSSRIVFSDRPAAQPYDLYADIREAERVIGFRPTPLHESLDRYIDELLAKS